MVATVWSKEGCPPCADAMEMLATRGIAFTALKLGKDFTREEAIERFGEGVTLPKIEMDGRLFRTSTELRRFLES